jgi:hypothetical protein
MTLAAYANAAKAVCDWINSQSDDLIGRGNPLAAGAHTKPQKSPGAGAVAYVTTVSTTGDSGEAPMSYALVSCSVYGMTDDNAHDGAVALANALYALDGNPVHAAGAVLLACDQITGPTRLPDGTEHRYLVDALIAITSA